jgi:MFS family permease
MTINLNRTTRILLLGANLWYFGEGMLGPLFAVFSEKVGGDILDISWAWAAYLVVTGVCYIIVGRLINGKPYQAKVMVAGYGLNALLTYCYCFVHNSWQLFFVQAGLGVAEAIGTPAWDALYAKNMSDEHDTFAWGLSTGQSQIVTGLAIFAGGMIAHYASFNLLFIIMGSMQVVATIVQARILYVKSI